MIDANDEMSFEDTLHQYRAAKKLPNELLMSCKILLEEKLFSNALSLENALCTSSSVLDSPSFVPPISHLCLVSTLLVHPNYTTRSKDNRERTEILPKALSYLRNVLAIVGPGNARLGEAFSFKVQNQRHSNGRSTKRVVSNRSYNSSSSDDDDGPSEDINIPLATTDSVWERAQDFWQVVGWAFNCSVAYKERWEYWKIWLDYMLDVIDADWLEREQRDFEAYETRKASDPEAELTCEARKNSILCQYTSSSRARTHFQRMMRSIFANGHGQYLKDFPEIFLKETSMPRNDEDSSRKRQKFAEVDLENGKFGGYGSSDDDGDLEDNDLDPSQQAPSPPVSSPGRDDHDSSMALGGHESVTLRLRLMALLSNASEVLPDDGAKIPIKFLYETFADALSSMPVHSLSLFVSTNSIPYLPASVLSTLCQFTLEDLIDNKAPRTEGYGFNAVDLAECFLPWAANLTSIEDNTKVSILLETLLRLYVKEPDIKYESSLDDFAVLKDAVEKGIQARETKTENDKRRKRTKSGNNVKDDDRFWLKCSGERMKLLMPIYEKKLMRARSDHESSHGSSQIEGGSMILTPEV